MSNAKRAGGSKSVAKGVASAGGAPETRRQRRPDEATKAAAEARHGALDRRHSLAAALHASFRKKLIEHLEGNGVPKGYQLQFLAEATGVTKQAAMKWLDTDKPGLPDLVSFYAICEACDSDANYLLDLTRAKLPLPPKEDEWISAFSAALLRAAGERVAMLVEGDEMDPVILAGDWVLVDPADHHWGTSGIFMIEYQGRKAVRTIEARFGEGYVLSCANPRYANTLVRDEAAAAKMGLKVIGRVTGKISTQRL